VRRVESKRDIVKHNPAVKIRSYRLPFFPKPRPLTALASSLSYSLPCMSSSRRRAPSLRASRRLVFNDTGKMAVDTLAPLLRLFPRQGLS
jgi:hypothetical protein